MNLNDRHQRKVSNSLIRNSIELNLIAACRSPDPVASNSKIQIAERGRNEFLNEQPGALPEAVAQKDGREKVPGLRPAEQKLQHRNSKMVERTTLSHQFGHVSILRSVQ